MSRLISYEQLTDGQKHAFDVAMRRIAKGKNTIIQGHAGTGKTTLMRCFVQFLTQKGLRVLLCAPTHAAKKVLGKTVGKRAYTLHCVLKINPNTYEDELVFDQRKVPKFDDYDVIVIDECSMIDHKLFAIMMRSIPSRIAIVGLGDKEQIRPVAPKESVPQRSPIFGDDRFELVTLTQVKRNGGALLDVATEIRNGAWISPRTDDGLTGVFKHETLNTFFQQYFSVVHTPEDFHNVRILAYTNKSVNKLNGIVRRSIYGQNVGPVVKDEILVMQEPYMVEKKSADGEKIVDVIYNNGEQIKVLNFHPVKIELSCKYMEESAMINAIAIETISIDDEDDESRNFGKVDALKDLQVEAGSETEQQTHWINVIMDEFEENRYHNYMSSLAGRYREMLANGKRVRWDRFWELKRQFQRARALPATTYHKSQGSTVDQVFLFTPDLNNPNLDGEQVGELLYVGTTRARTRVDYV